eukprot:gene6702-7553_t
MNMVSKYPLEITSSHPTQYFSKWTNNLHAPQFTELDVVQSLKCMANVEADLKALQDSKLGAAVQDNCASS